MLFLFEAIPFCFLQIWMILGSVLRFLVVGSGHSFGEFRVWRRRAVLRLVVFGKDGKESPEPNDREQINVKGIREGGPVDLGEDEHDYEEASLEFDQVHQGLACHPWSEHHLIKSKPALVAHLSKTILLINLLKFMTVRCPCKIDESYLKTNWVESEYDGYEFNWLLYQIRASSSFPEAGVLERPIVLRLMSLSTRGLVLQLCGRSFWERNKIQK